MCFFALEPGTDPVGYVLSANIHRRHLNAGQKAMAVAMIHPEPAKGGRGKTVDSVNGFDRAYLSRARAVLRHSEQRPLQAGGYFFRQSERRSVGACFDVR